MKSLLENPYAETYTSLLQISTINDFNCGKAIKLRLANAVFNEERLSASHKKALKKMQSHGMSISVTDIYSRDLFRLAKERAIGREVVSSCDELQNLIAIAAIGRNDECNIDDRNQSILIYLRDDTARHLNAIDQELADHYANYKATLSTIRLALFQAMFEFGTGRTFYVRKISITHGVSKERIHAIERDFSALLPKFVADRARQVLSGAPPNALLASYLPKLVGILKSDEGVRRFLNVCCEFMSVLPELISEESRKIHRLFLESGGPIRKEVSTPLKLGHT